MRPELSQYNQLASHLAEVGADEYMKHGDWTLLVAIRASLQVVKEAEADTVAATDEHIKKHLSSAHLDKIADLMPDLPITEWWG